MARSVNCTTYCGNIGSHPGRCFVVNHANSFDKVLGVLAQTIFNKICLDTTPPSFNTGKPEELRLEPQSLCHFFPECGEMARFVHQHCIARAEGIGQCGFPGTSA